MMYRPVRIEAPTSLPVTLAQVKAALDIPYVEKDELIKGLMAAAVSHLDGWTGILGRALCEQTWRQDFDYFCWELRLPIFPVISVASVNYTDVNGAEQTVAAESYSVLTDGLGAFVRFKNGFSFPTTKAFESAAVRVSYVCGHEDDDEENPLPAAIKQAIMLLVRHWFDNPTAVIVGTTAEKMPMAVDALLAPYRRVRF